MPPVMPPRITIARVGNDSINGAVEPAINTSRIVPQTPIPKAISIQAEPCGLWTTPTK